MLKGNLIVGKNQSVVVHAESLHDLIKLAESKSHGSNGCDSLTLRVDLTESAIVVDMPFGRENERLAAKRVRKNRL